MQNEDIDDGTTEEQFKHMLKQAVLRHYPNPERKGCLDSPTIHGIAQQRLPHEDARWEHVSHCSPCYREFLDSRNQFLEARTRAKGRKRGLLWLTIVVGIGLVGLAAMAILKSP